MQDLQQIHETSRDRRLRLMWGMKSAAEKTSMVDYLKVRDIMDQVYQEDPTKWPQGLDIPSHDGGVYMIRSASGDAAGFVGWQERVKEGKTVGYYTVGVLPEFRGKGMAKAALNKLLEEKRAGVDEVHAFIAPQNVPSRKLAEALGVKVELSN